jgi:hypothetical protein
MSDTSTSNHTDTTGALLKRISELDQLLLVANGEAKKRKVALYAEREAHSRTKAELATVTTERDDFKGKVETSPAEWKSKAEALQAQLNSRDARDAWKAVIGDGLRDKVTMEKVWAEIQYTPGDVIPTPEEITEQVKAARDAAPYLFKDETAETATAAPGGATKTPLPPLKETVGVGRGAPDTSVRRVTVRHSQLQDPQWALDAKNQKMMANAQADGTLEIVPG